MRPLLVVHSVHPPFAPPDVNKTPDPPAPPALYYSLPYTYTLTHSHARTHTHTHTHSLTFTLSSLSVPPSSFSFTPPHPPLQSSLHFSRSLINRLIGNTTYHQSSGIGAPARFGAFQLRASVPTYAVLFPSLSPLYLSSPLSIPLFSSLGTWYCSPLWGTR